MGTSRSPRVWNLDTKARQTAQQPFRLLTSIQPSTQEHCQCIAKQETGRNSRRDGTQNDLKLVAEVLTPLDVLLRIHWQFR